MNHCGHYFVHSFVSHAGDSVLLIIIANSDIHLDHDHDDLMTRIKAMSAVANEIRQERRAMSLITWYFSGGSGFRRGPQRRLANRGMIIPR
jgi:hypothetical protein